jgi:hypothetical protein
MSKDLYCIYSESEEGYWSNENGWGSIEIATPFTRDDVYKFSRRRNREEVKRPNVMSAGDDACWVQVQLTEYKKGGRISP